MPRRLLLLCSLALGVLAARPAAGQAAWTDPAAPPCDALSAFRAASVPERTLSAGDLRERSEHFTIHTADGIGAPADSAVVWIDYMESGETFGATLYLRPAGLVRPTTTETWDGDASDLIFAIAEPLAACFGETLSTFSKMTDDEAGSRYLTLLVTDDTSVRVDLREDGGTARLVPEIAVGLSY